MQYRTLGKTGIRVSALAMGAGPIAAVMTSDNVQLQQRLVRHAVQAGINWFDTAATYGDGRSETNLGKALRELSAADRVHVATKVRVMPSQLQDIEQTVRTSLRLSLQRLGLPKVTLLQLHNAITARRGDEPTSLTPADVLGPVLDAMKDLQASGLVQHLGFTGIGSAEALREVVESGQFEAMQVPFNLANPSAGQAVPVDFDEANYGNPIAACRQQHMGVLAIRVFAAGALLSQPPSRHTYTTKFFPYELYQRDVQRADRIARLLGARMSVKEAALRFVLSHDDVSAAIIGYADPSQVDEALEILRAGPLPAELLAEIHQAEYLVVHAK